MVCLQVPDTTHSMAVLQRGAQVALKGKDAGAGVGLMQLVQSSNEPSIHADLGISIAVGAAMLSGMLCQLPPNCASGVAASAQQATQSCMGCHLPFLPPLVFCCRSCAV